MQRSYGVVWREGNRPPVPGKLELLPRGVVLEGREGSREIAYDQLRGVHVGRSAAERLDGRPSVVLERRFGEPVVIATVAQASMIGEIAERLAELQVGEPRASRVVVVLPLKPGAHHDVRALLDAGPPFDPEEIAGLDRHEVFVTASEVVFLFDSDSGADALMALLARPDVLSMAAAWREHLAGPPRVADEVFAWSRLHEPADVYYLPTPGPGDSEGGDIY
jgi:hypothetical protein